MEGPYLCLKWTAAVIIYNTFGLVLLYFPPLIIITILNSRIMVINLALRRTNPLIKKKKTGKLKLTKEDVNGMKEMKIVISINVIFFNICCCHAMNIFLSKCLKDLKVHVLESLFLICFFLLLFSTVQRRMLVIPSCAVLASGEICYPWTKIRVKHITKLTGLKSKRDKLDGTKVVIN